MKNILSKTLMALPLSFASIVPAIAITSCNNKKSDQLVTCKEDYWSDEQTKTIQSLKTIDGNKDLLYLDYTADYKLDDYVKLSPGSVHSQYSRNDAFNKVLLNGKSKYVLPTPTNSGACTAIAVKGADGKQYMARSMDWNYDGAYDLVLRTHAHPESGSKYDTLTMAHSSWFYGQYDKVNEPSHAESLLYAPLSCCPDGINSAGLAISCLDLEWGACRQAYDNAKPDVSFWMLNRLVLDKCATVNEALELLNNYNFYSSHNAGGEESLKTATSNHWLIQDKNGNKATFIFDGSDYINNARLIVTRGQTKITKFNDEFDKEHGCFNVELQYSSATHEDNMWITNFYMNEMDPVKRKGDVSSDSEGYYRGYVIQETLKQTPRPTFDQIRLMLESVAYSADVDLIFRYINAGLDPTDPEVWENWQTVYSNIYDIEGKKMTIYKLEDYNKPYVISM